MGPEDQFDLLGGNGTLELRMKKWNERLTGLLNRDHLPTWLNLNYPHGKMVEVGTYYGEFAHHILIHWKGELTCIDPWEDQPDEAYRDGCANGGRAGGRNPMEPIYQHALKNLMALGKRCTVMREFSSQAIDRFDRGALDCVYIDGNHRYEAVMFDLRRWHEKLRIGGLIGTHDCYIREDAVQTCGVWDAVWDYGHEIGMRPFLTNCGSAWWIKE